MTSFYVSYFWKFKVWLTDDIISFEQPHPGVIVVIVSSSYLNFVFSGLAFVCDNALSGKTLNLVKFLWYFIMEINYLRIQSQVFVNLWKI